MTLKDRQSSAGLSLLETSIALSMIALFAAVFVSLSARLAHAQHQQETRAAALSVLESTFNELKETSSDQWVGPWSNQVKRNGLTFDISVTLDAADSKIDEGFAVFEGTVSWESKTGPQKIQREVWVHERLN